MTTDDQAISFLIESMEKNYGLNSTPFNAWWNKGLIGYRTNNKMLWGNGNKVISIDRLLPLIDLVYDWENENGSVSGFVYRGKQIFNYIGYFNENNEDQSLIGSGSGYLIDIPFEMIVENAKSTVLNSTSIRSYHIPRGTLPSESTIGWSAFQGLKMVDQVKGGQHFQTIMDPVLSESELLAIEQERRISIAIKALERRGATQEGIDQIIMNEMITQADENKQLVESMILNDPVEPIMIEDVKEVYEIFEHRYVPPPIRREIQSNLAIPLIALAVLM